jgi:hypothetical protein
MCCEISDGILKHKLKLKTIMDAKLQNFPNLHPPPPPANEYNVVFGFNEI